MSERLPDSHGDVTAEYLALRNQAGLTGPYHGLAWAQGVDAVSFLQDLVSQEVAGMPVGAVARSLLLAPQGKLRAQLWLLRDEEGVGLVTERDRVELMVDDLLRYRIRVRVEITPDPRPVLEVWGPEAAGVLERSDLPVPDGWDRAGEVVVASAPLGGLPRFMVVGAETSRLAEAGAAPAGTLAATAVRVEAGEPVMGRDVDESTIPQEAGLVEGTVSFEKGCYLGQELVARIDSRGHVNRHLRGVVILENVLPPEGAELVDGDRVVGTISSVAESLTLRAPVGLALVRREVEPGQVVEVRWPGASARAQVRTLPLDDFA